MTSLAASLARLDGGLLRCAAGRRAARREGRHRRGEPGDRPGRHRTGAGSGRDRGAASLALTAIARTRTPRLAAAGGTLAVLGAISGIVVATTALVGGQIARQGTDAGMVELWTRIWSDGRLGPPLLVSGIVGFIVLAIGLFRSGAIPRTAALLVGIAGVATLVTSVGPLRPLVVGAAVLAAVAFSWVAVAARRTPSTTASAPIAHPVGN